MKHAYLIIVHHEFDLLSRLLQALDDIRNDIYIHFDRKIVAVPELKTKYAGLYLLQDRIDVNWGDISQIETELHLFKIASAKKVYSYFHILSGVDFPLKSQDYIHQFFESHQGKEFIGFYQGDNTAELTRKVQRYHIFPKYFRFKKSLSGIFIRALRYLLLQIQELFGLYRNKKTIFKKGMNWVSVTPDFVHYLLSQQVQILKDYKNTFCADEIFLQTICWNSPFRDRLFDAYNEGRGCMRLVGWTNNKLVEWENKDYRILKNSEALFARKFIGTDLIIVDRILNEIQS